MMAADDTQPFVLVLDPGHGGKDIGAPGACRKTTESAVVLDVAKRVGRMVENADLDIKTVYTRKTDRFVTLQGRADIANKAHGDLFVSIHCNSVKSGGNNVQGTSVYTLGSGKSSENLRVAMRENSVIELEPDYTAKYSGFDPNSVESYILFELVTTAGRVDKRLRQANFWVLWATSMPAVLVELDFICNPTIEAFFADEEGREKCAQAIFNAIKTYYERTIRQKEAGKQHTASADRPNGKKKR
ncbi:MAG TPA: N-acetylmuramoyl-L-alanine amidase [Muribaculaceae bacterium]|nr:N-acetylmuramoyl-L-alanine amidase [Muribaculaceae bacterium]